MLHSGALETKPLTPPLWISRINNIGLMEDLSATPRPYPYSSHCPPISVVLNHHFPQIVPFPYLLVLYKRLALENILVLTLVVHANGLQDFLTVRNLSQSPHRNHRLKMFFFLSCFVLYIVICALCLL